MAYCIQCGNPIEENIKFCSSCGHSVYHPQQNKSEKTNSREVIHCTTCGHEVSVDAKFCHNCAHSLTPVKTVASTVTPDFHVEKKESPISGNSDKRTNGRQRKIGIIIIIAITLLGVCIAAVILLSAPTDQYLKIGNSQYLFSKEAQQYIRIEETSEYVSNKSILIIEEPHSDLGKQFNLYKGLEIFFRDNPNLINKTTFLAEGYPSQQTISVQPLIDVEPNPDDETIKTVLGSFLINGYLAYVWKDSPAIQIIGIENEKLYDLSVREYQNLVNNPKSDVQNNMWEFTVAARNEQIAEVVKEVKNTYENPVLFVGGLHLISQDETSFQTSKQTVASQNPDLKSVEYAKNRGIRDYLEEQKIGYTFLTARSDINTTIEDQNTWNERYTELFYAQTDDEYDFYSEWVAVQMLEAKGVTTKPSVSKAAGFLQTIKGLFKKMFGGGNNGDGPKVVAKFNPNDHSQQKDGDYMYTWDPRIEAKRGNAPHWDRGPLKGGKGTWSPDGITWRNK
jgi:DNA-directed RNA polymerase subunit RPC12/RpoP